MADPLKPIHAIHEVVHDLVALATAADRVGLPIGEELHALANEIYNLATDAANEVMANAHEDYVQARKQTAHTLVALLDASLVTEDKS